MQVKRVSPKDDLHGLVADINRAVWDQANEMTPYYIESLRSYLAYQDTVFVTCYDEEGTFMGMASSRLQPKPYNESQWLYVDEVDVCADQRRRGAAKQMMRFLIEFARENRCDELWVATEDDNQPAKALYQSLTPDEVMQVIGYTYEVS